ncbi:DUF6906 family protein [Faecalimicrobium sp. JNUCC 81]
MKQGKKLTRKQREVLESNGYNSSEWLLERKNNLEYTYVNREKDVTIKLKINA